jgi:hypothetical protein
MVATRQTGCGQTVVARELYDAAGLPVVPHHPAPRCRLRGVFRFAVHIGMIGAH